MPVIKGMKSEEDGDFSGTCCFGVIDYPQGGNAFGDAKLLPSGFPILTLLQRIECMSFAYHSPNNPKRSSSLNLIARVAQRCWRKSKLSLGGINTN